MPRIEASKPIEYFIYLNKIYGSLHFSLTPIKDSALYDFKNHVIEYSAYEEIKYLKEMGDQRIERDRFRVKENKRLQKINEIYRKALEECKKRTTRAVNIIVKEAFEQVKKLEEK